MIAHRRAWIAIAVWIALVAVAAPLAGRLTSAQDNGSSAYLAADAESTRVLAWQAIRAPAEMPAIVVYSRASGITGADQARATADTAAFASIAGVRGPVTAPLLAADGTALRVVVPIASGSGGWDQIAGPVDALRAVLGPAAGGLAVHVTGPAGVIADTSGSFSGLDGTLLYTTLAVVVVILLLTYRSPVLWILPIACVGVALTAAQATAYLAARYGGLTVNAQSASILTVLVFGAGTDYALLLVARYREELGRHSDRWVAMRAARRRATPAIVASGATVTAGMLCLLVASTNSTRGMGPIAAIGVIAALVAVLTLLPAALVLCGRWIFWPAVPAVGAVTGAGGPWARIGALISRRPRVTWIATALALGALALGLGGLRTSGLTADNSFVTTPDSVVGARVLAAHYPAGDGQPVVVVSAAAGMRAALAATPGVAAVAADPDGHLGVTLAAPADSSRAQADVRALRAVAHRVDPGALVGGPTAVLVDTDDAAVRDRDRIVPLVLLVVLAILALLLRAAVAPVVLVATVVLSFAAALGAGALLFRHVWGWAGADPSLPLFVFVFLVALGVDYNIFLVTRVREETVAGGDTRAAARVGLAATGGVITSAGLVLAGTFAALATLPLIAYAQIGVAVALGVLLDAVVVRAVLVTALTVDIGRWMWWPGRLARAER